MTLRRYYLHIPHLNIIRCYMAVSFTDAKAQAADDYLPHWNLIQWL